MEGTFKCLNARGDERRGDVRSLTIILLLAQLRRHCFHTRAAQRVAPSSPFFSPPSPPLSLSLSLSLSCSIVLIAALQQLSSVRAIRVIQPACIFASNSARSRRGGLRRRFNPLTPDWIPARDTTLLRFPAKQKSFQRYPTCLSYPGRRAPSSCRTGLRRNRVIVDAISPAETRCD
jgi:hypothetical protein